MLDLLITNASLPDGRTGMSIAVQDGRITEVTPGLTAPAAQSVDAAGYLVTPPFCDPHFHMDATLSYGLPRVNESGTLLEGIALWGELKPTLTAEAIIERALTYCDWAVAKGLLAIRSHVDTSDASLLPVEALLEVKRRVAPYIDLQLVAFPQDGVLRTPGGVDNLKRALDMGVDIVGGIPLINITLQGRHDSYPRRRGMTRVPELMAAGVNVAFGHDCVMDPWYGMGSGDMLEVAHMGLHVAQMTSQKGIRSCFDAVTVNAAKVMHLESYGIEAGCDASFVLLQARDSIEAIRLRANRLRVWRKGVVVAETAEVVARLQVPRRSAKVDYQRL